jgi:Domain of unknown function (DUF397)
MAGGTASHLGAVRSSASRCRGAGSGCDGSMIFDLASTLAAVVSAFCDTADPHGPVLGFAAAAWRAFIGGVRDGEFDGFGRAAWSRSSLSPANGACVEMASRLGGWFSVWSVPTSSAEVKDAHPCVCPMTLGLAGSGWRALARDHRRGNRENWRCPEARRTLTSRPALRRSMR